MPGSERISIREFAGALISDPWRVLASIALAVLLWFYLDAQVSQSDEVELPLQVADVAGDLDTSEGTRLFVRLDTSTFSVIGFEDPTTSGRTESVTLHLTGAKRAIESIAENPGFMVRIEPTPDQDGLVAEFTAEDVRPMNPRFEGLIARMSPPRVVASIGRNVEEPVLIGRDRIEFVAPASAPDLGERLLWDDAKYDPKVVKMRGPAQALKAIGDQRRLFRFAPEAPLASATRCQGLLRPVDLPPQVTLIPDPVAVEVPIRVDPRTFRLPDVPVLMHEPDELRGRFELRRATVDVEIEAFGTLEATLSGLSEEKLREWASEDARLVASLPSDAVDEAMITNPRLVITNFFERIDFRMTVPPTIHFDLKKP